MKSLGHPITLEQANAMVDEVDDNKDGAITRTEFDALMVPIMMEMLLATEDTMEATRALFREADTDHSGFLTADQVYAVLLKQGVDLSREELVALMEEFDMNADASLDIDEFVTMMNLGDGVQFSGEASKNSYLKIRKARRLGVLDFIRAFGSLPASFMPSSFTERWTAKKNLPSSVLKPQVDPRTMLWKDMYPVRIEQLTQEQRQPEFKPQYRPIENHIGIEITL